ncbi:MAG: hypothetical protein WDA16_08325 [Candidatus Thermoplasmatota archaeon]
MLGTGASGNATSAQSGSTDTTGFYVNIPTARLAIGNVENTTYDDEDAFVVDLGGHNKYHMNAGGFVPQLLARAEGASPTGDPLHPLSSLYPVSLLLDVGSDGAGSEYKTSGGLAQGAGYFSVGVLADLGGNDSFVVLPTPVPSMASSWMPQTPTLDGTIGAIEWANANATQLTLTDLEDPRFVEPLTLRVANDAHNVYLALSGHTSSTLTDGVKDTLVVDLNAGRSLKTWDGAHSRTLLDSSIITIDHNRCGPNTDSYADENTASNDLYQQDTQNDTRVGCSVNEDGSFTIELVKPLVRGLVSDAGDLDIPYGANGYNPSELGFHVELYEHTTGTMFTYPAGTVSMDGQNGYRPDSNLSDEMEDWTVLGLASLGKNGTAPIVTKQPAFAQGASIAGVGILAALGQTSADGAKYAASDRAQGYAVFGGLGVLVDAGGSDAYTGGQFVQGASDAHSLAIFLEMDGNEIYSNSGHALGWAPDLGGALFADLSGYDTYRTATGGASDHNPRNATVTADGGSSRDTRGATTQTTPVGNAQTWSGDQGGHGLDTALGTILPQLPMDSLFGNTHTKLTIQPSNNGLCSGKSSDLPTETFGLRNLTVVHGVVCLVAKTSVTDTSTQGIFAVDSVEFSIDGQYYATVLSPTIGTSLDGKFVVPLDVTTLRDGVRSIFAQSTVRVTIPQRDVILFHDHNVDDNLDPILRVVVNNPSHAAICTLPKLDVESQYAADPCSSQMPAVFSPTALNATRTLGVLWGVSHDAFEDQHELSQGWALPADKRNVPCPDEKLGSCNVIPLWFNKPGNQWTTQQPGYKSYDPDVTNVQYENDLPYTQKTDVLQENLTVVQKEGFHVRLFNHSVLLLPGTYTTHIIVKLLDAKNSTIATIAEDTYGSTQTPVATNTQDPVGVGGALSSVFETVRNTVNGNPSASGALDTVDYYLKSNPVPSLYDLLCTSGNEPGTLNTCGDIMGNPGSPVGNAYLCSDESPWNSLPGGTVPGCDPTLSETENGTANNANSALSATSVRRTVNETGNPDPAPILNWSDFYIDLKTPEEGSPLIAGDGTVTIPRGYKFQFDMYISSDSILSKTVESTLDWYTLYHGAITTNVNTAYNATNDTYSTGADSAGAACDPAQGVCAFTNETVRSTVPYQLWQTVGDKENRAPAKVTHPIPLATFHMGDPSNPSVFEIRSPITPHTSANIVVEPVDQAGNSGAPVATLTNAIVPGDIAGSPNENQILCDNSGMDLAKTALCSQFLDAMRSDREECKADLAVNGSHSYPDSLACRQLDADRAALQDACSASIFACHDNYGFAIDPIALRFTQHNDKFDGGGLSDGLYRAHLRSADDSNKNLAEDNQSFLLDNTTPYTVVTTGRGFVGAALLSGGNKVPVSWDTVENGAGLKQVAVWGHTGKSRLSEPTSWHPIGCTIGTSQSAKSCAFPGSISAAKYDDRVTTITDYYFITVGEDRAGNVEFQDQIRELNITDADLLYAGFLAKLQTGINADGSFEPLIVTRLIVDSARPTGKDVGTDGTHIGSYGGVDTAKFVKAGAPFTATVCATDTGTRVDMVRIVFDYVDPATGNVTSWNATTTNMGADVNMCPQGGELYSFGGWGDVNANKTMFPDGAWAVSADIFDLAGNRDQVSIANVILDGGVPQARIVDVQYPPDQSAAGPEDSILLRIAANDTFGLDADATQIDASALNATGMIKHCVGAQRIEPCISHKSLKNVAKGLLFEVAFKVNVAGIRDGDHTIPVTVFDLAGNAVTLNVTVLVDTKHVELVPGSIVTSGTTYNATTLSWRTTVNSTSAVLYGTDQNAMKGRTYNASLVTDHAVTVMGLTANTPYFMKIVSTTAGGNKTSSDILRIVTGTALYLTPLSPAEGSSVSGAVPVRFSGGLHDSTDAVAYTLEVQPSEDQPWTFVTMLTETGEDHELTFNSSRFLDGSTYHLRLTAGVGKDVFSRVIGPFLSDNTPPELTVLSPLVATNDSTPQIVADARDNLAGFGGTSEATLLIDGQSVTGVVLEKAGDGVRVKYDVPSALSQGYHTFSLLVPDKAGNPGSETWKVAIDGQAPVVTVATPKFSPGTTAAKNGGTITLNVTATDASGVATIVADTSALSDKAQTRLDHVTGTPFWVATFNVIASDLDATKHVTITATDIAGNARIAGLDITVDNAPPVVGRARASDISQTKATLTAEANEPVTIFVTATATGVPSVTARTPTPGVHPTIELVGLFPSRTYAFQVQALDRSGNEVDQNGEFQTALDLKPPTQVGVLSVLDLLNGTLRFSWPEAHDDVAVAFYRVYRSDTNGTLRPIAEVRGLTFDDVGLQLEKPFEYQVAAVDYGGNEGTLSNAIRATATAVPRLSGGVVSPTVGATATVFRYVITYSSPGGVAPAFVRVILDGAPQEMRAVGDGAFVFETRLAPHTRDHPHTYSFEAGDGRYTVRFPEDGSSLRGPLVSGDASADAGSSFVGFAQKVPMLGILGTASALAVAAAAALILRRRGSK